MIAFHSRWMGLLAVLILGCTADRMLEPNLNSATDAVTLIGAGDIASCSSSGRDEQTATLIQAEPGALVFTAGDNAYPEGAPADFANCYAPSWGLFKDRTYPTPGNHEYNWPDKTSSVAAPYFDYFNGVGIDSGRAGGRGRGWYVVDHGAWRLLFVNSERAIVTQAAWIRQALATDPRQCELAIWHRPRYTSGPLRTKLSYLQPLWDALAAERAELVIAGHDHHYERFREDGYGLRSFVAGGGGHGSLNTFDTIHPLSEVRVRAHGVLWLELGLGSYRWEYRQIDGTLADSGSGTCHSDTPGVVPPITLNVSGARLDSFYRNELRWTGANGDSVEVWKDGLLRKRELNDGRYVNQQLYTGPDTFAYRLCERGSDVCSNTATVGYP